MSRLCPQFILTVTTFAFIFIFHSTATAQSNPDAWLEKQKNHCFNTGIIICQREKVPTSYALYRLEFHDDRWIEKCISNTPSCTDCDVQKKCYYGFTDLQYQRCIDSCTRQKKDFEEMYQKTSEYAQKLAAQRERDKQWQAAIKAEKERKAAETEAKRQAEEKRRQEELAARANQRQKMIQELITKAKSSKKYSCKVACVKNKLSKEIIIFDGNTPAKVPEIYIASDGEFSKDNFEKSPNVMLCNSICQ